MKQRKHFIGDMIITVLVMGLCFGAGILMHDVFKIPEQVTTTFAFGVFLVALLTDGYFWGVVASVASLLLVNYAFTFPYFALDFLIPSNFYSAVVMATIAVLTSALTTKVKYQEAIKAETEKEKMRANLLRAVSHDLRTPLTTIYGSCTALRENGAGLTDEQKDRMLQGIQKDSQWLVRMVENLLSVTRLDGNQVRLKKDETVLDELVDALMAKFRKHYPNQKVLLQLPEETVSIPMDPILIEQVLMNLLENAVFHAHGMEHLWLSVEVQGNRAVFRVADDGCGIPAERMSGLFTGLLDSAAPTDTSRSNMGIGLSVCSAIVKAHGSEIQAGNRPAGGAEFCFALDMEAQGNGK